MNVKWIIAIWIWKGLNEYDEDVNKSLLVFEHIQAALANDHGKIDLWTSFIE